MAPKATKPPYFAPVTGSAGLWQTTKPGFAALASQSLGGAGGPADGFDSGYLNLLNAFDAAHPLIDAISSAGADLARAVEAAGAIPMGDIDKAIDAATRNTGPMLAGLAAAVGSLNFASAAPGGVPQPPTPPVIDLGAGAPAGAGSGGSVFQEATYVQTVSDGAAIALEGLIGAHVIGGALATAAVAALPIIGIAIGVGLILVHYLGHGCGAPCIDAAKSEQIYEAAADDIFAAYRLGMVTLGQAVAIMAHIWSAGTQHLNGFNTPQATKGALNMQHTITAEIAAAQKLTPPKPTALNLDAAHLAYVRGPGWYPDSLAAGAALADEYLNALAAQKG